MSERVYLSPPDIGARERRLVADAFDSGWIAPLGPHVDAFEDELSRACGVAAAAALSSGTAALHLALRDAGVGPGDTVMCPTLTFVASVNPVLYERAAPVFVDCSVDTWTVDPELLESAIADRIAAGKQAPKAVVAVDLYGQCADYERIEAICRHYGIALIEDAAEALGSTAYGRPAGSFGDYGILSFNGNKIITTSGGGALLTHDTATAERARSVASQARDPAPHYQHSEIGFNYRMSNVLAAVGRGQLEDLPRRVQRRRAIFSKYVELLGDLPGITFMPEAAYGTSNRWLTTLTIDPAHFGNDRETIRLELEGRNIESRPLWNPMHRQPLFRDCPVIQGSVADRLFEQGLCLPSGSSLSDAQLEMVAEVIIALHRP